MSWETLTVGGFELKDNVSKEQKEKFILELKNIVEAEIELEPSGEEYYFSDVNWNSRVKGRKIGEFVKKNKQLLKRFDCSVYYLSNPDEQVFYDEDNDEEVEITEI